MKKFLLFLLVFVLVIPNFGCQSPKDYQAADLVNAKNGFVLKGLSYGMSSRDVLKKLSLPADTKAETQTPGDPSQIAFEVYSVKNVMLLGEPFGLELKFLQDKLVRCSFSMESDNNLQKVYDRFSGEFQKLCDLGEEEVVENIVTKQKVAYDQNVFRSCKSTTEPETGLAISGFVQQNESKPDMTRIEIDTFQTNLPIK